MAFLSKEELLMEYAKCHKDTPYTLKTYLETWDNTQSKFVPLNLFEDQIQLILDYESSNENIVVKYRQAGVSTVTAAWTAKKLAFTPKSKPEKILIIANKQETAIEFASKIRNFLVQFPEWMGVTFDKKKDSQSHFKLTNGCEVKAVATSKDALRGYTPTILIFDEAAYVETEEDFWSACMASLSTGGQNIVISTPNGRDPIYFELYNQALNGLNDYKVSYLHWYHDPRFTKDLKWVKCSDIVHYMLNPELYNEAEVTKEEFDKSKFDDLIKQGYKPYSSWFYSMAKKMKYDKRKIGQEISVDFLSSGDNVFDLDITKRLQEECVKEPIKKEMSSQFWFWDPPITGHKYIAGIDVATGESDDFSCISIIDFDERKQVAEYVGKIPPDELGEVAFKFAGAYNAFMVVDTTGAGVGLMTVRKLQDIGYKNLYIEGASMSTWKYDPKIYEKTPGLHFQNKRVQIIAALEEALRHGFIVRSSRFLSECETFIYKNGKADHQKNAHDDAIMALAMALYAAEISFTMLQKSDETTKALLNSWTMNEHTPTTGIPPISPQTSNFDPFMTSPTRFNNKQDPTRRMYEQYSWLFGKPKQ